MFIYNFLVENKKSIVTLAILLGLTVGGIALGDVLIYGGSNVIYGDSSGEPTFGSVTAVQGVCSGYEPTTQLCQVNIRELQVETELTAVATTTVQEITLGSRYSTALDFSAGATSTDGGLVALQNTGAAKICQDVIVEVTTATTDGGPVGTGGKLGFKFATSTSATDWADDTFTLLTASTTQFATGTKGFISNIVQTGSYTTNDADAGAPWLWDHDVYILGAFDVVTAEGNALVASSTAYDDTVGKMYVHCITR